MSATLPAGARFWALVAHSQAELERVPLVGAWPSQTRQPWRVWHLRQRDQPTDVAWAFVPTDGRRPLGYGLAPSELLVGEDATVLVDSVAWEITARAEAPHLFAALPLMPVPCLRPAEVMVFFTTQQELADAVRAALVLGGKDLQVGAVVREGGEGSEPLHILYLPHPSVFLVDTWRAAERKLFRRASQHVWLELGWGHPWEAGFAHLADSRAGMLLVGTEGWSALPQVSLSDAWACMRAAGDLDAEGWTPTSSPHFTVPMRWSARRQPATPELWLLDDDEMPALEVLLSTLSERDLGNLQLATLTSSDGQTSFVVREAIAGHSSHYLHVGTPFCPVTGVPGLFLPATLGLEPPVPRSELGALFSARAGKITLVLPHTAAEDDAGAATNGLAVAHPADERAMRVIAFDESAFAPLESLVEHIVCGASEVFAPILARSAVDLGELAKLDWAQQPAPPASDRPPPGVPSLPDDELHHDAPFMGSEWAEDGTEDHDIDGDAAPWSATPSAVADSAPADLSQESVLSEAEHLRRLEDEAEEQAILALEDASRWTEVARHKARRGAVLEAVTCLEHAAWVAAEPQRGHIEAELASWLRALARDAPAALQLRAAVHRFVPQHPTESSEAFGARLAALVTTLRRDEHTLPKRARWRAWKEVLRHSPDEVEAARVVDSLLGELSMRGVDESDSFPFARRQIRRRAERRQLEPSVLGPLHRMVDVCDGMEREDLRLECLGALAGVFDAAGEGDAAIALLTRTTQHLESLPRAAGGSAFATCAAAAAGQHGGAAELFREAITRVAAMRDGLEKDRALVDVLEQLQQASLIEAEGTLLESVLQVIDASPPNRQTIQLSDCAGLLYDLGASEATLERLERLLRVPALGRDAWPLASVLDAMVVCRAGRPPAAVSALYALDALLALPEIDESAARALDRAVAGAGGEALAVVQRAVVEREGLASLLLESVVIRGLAAQLLVDEGLSRLRDAIQAAWHLPTGPAIATALRRLVPCAAYFGRPAAGLALLDGVIARFAEEHAQRVGPREQGAVLTACAHAASQLGADDTALELLGRIIGAFEALVHGRSVGVAYLFEILGLVVDQVIALGTPSVGLGLIERAIASIARRLDNTPRADHPYFLHQARIKCAVAMLSLDATRRGEALLSEAMRDIAAVRQLDAHDRVDLCVDALRALSLALDEAPAELLSLLLDTGLGRGPTGAYGDTLQRTLIRGVTRTLLLRHDAYRLALTKFRAREERVLRERLLRDPLVTLSP